MSLIDTSELLFCLKVDLNVWGIGLTAEDRCLQDALLRECKTVVLIPGQLHCHSFRFGMCEWEQVGRDYSEVVPTGSPEL